MFEYMLAVEISKLEAELLESKMARRYQAGIVTIEKEKQPLAALAVASSHILQSLGNALISAGERLNNGRTSGRAAAA
jgi:hypothetical protein